MSTDVETRESSAVAEDVASLGASAEDTDPIQRTARCFAALAASPSHSMLLYETGWLLMGRGDPALAMPCFSTAVLTEPTWPNAWVSLAEALLRVGDAGAAFSLIKRVQQMGVQDPAVPDIAERANAALSEHEPLTFDMDALQVEIGQCLREQRWELARLAACRSLAIEPGNPVTWALLAVSLEWLDQPEAAEWALRRAVEVRPTLSPAWNNLGLLLQTQGRLDEAEQAYRAALEQAPSIETILNLANLKLLRGDPPGAVAVCDRAAEAGVDVPTLYEIRGSALRQMGDLDGAIEALRRATALDTDGWLAQAELGEALTAANREDEAETWLRKAAEQGGHPLVLVSLADLLRKKGRRQDAETLLRQAVRQDATCAPALTAWGSLCMDAGSFEEAVEAFSRALAIDPAASSDAVLGLVALAERGHGLETLREVLEARFSEDPALAGLGLDATTRAAVAAGLKAVAAAADDPAARSWAADLSARLGQ